MKIRRLVLSLACSLAASLCTAADPAKPEKKKEKEAGSNPLGTPVKLKPLTEAEQKTVLEGRIHGSMIGSMNSYASLLYAVNEISIGTDDKEAAETDLNSPFPDSYKPTVAELFESIARQSGTSMKYDTEKACWMFNKPAMPLPFKIELAKGWKSEDRGNYLFCKPPGESPVGMDVYVMGKYSATPADPKLAGQMKEAAALMFAKNFKKDASAKDMTTVKVGTFDALHFKTPAPAPGITWRQWALAENGQAYVIVSALGDDVAKELLPDVERMIQSFKLEPPAKSK